MKAVFSLLIMLTLSACSVTKLPNNLSHAMMNHDDPALVAAGAPAYLLLLDALILTYPNDKGFLLSGAQLYGAYAGVFSNTPEQAKKHADKAMSYARRALCAHDKYGCAMVDGPVHNLRASLDRHYNHKDLAIWYAYSVAWAGWIQANSSDWNAIAQLSKVKTVMNWVAEHDPSYDNATVLVYMGVLETQLPPSLGGQPELGREYFERALALTDNRHLMAKVLFAKQYARLMFEQALHDELLQQALAANPYQDGLTLMNHLAQQEARDLLASSADYFE